MAALQEGLRQCARRADDQAIQQVRAGLKAIYLSGWQVAADANLAGRCIPISRFTRQLRAAGGQADQPGAPARGSDRSSEGSTHYWFAPIVADAKRGLAR